MAIDWQEVARRLVGDTYRSTLGREADEGGRDYWVGQLMNGAITPDKLADTLRQQELTPTSYALQDADYAAFLRGANLQESEYESALASARDRLNRNLSQNTAMFDEQRRQSEQGVSDSWESRGLFRSGGRLVDTAEKRTQVDRNQALAHQSMTDTYSGQESDVTRQIAALRRQKLEQETAARQRLTSRDAQTALTRYEAGL
jgi:hypothetical protein